MIGNNAKSVKKTIEAIVMDLRPAWRHHPIIIEGAKASNQC